MNLRWRVLLPLGLVVIGGRSLLAPLVRGFPAELRSLTVLAYLVLAFFALGWVQRSRPFRHASLVVAADGVLAGVSGWVLGRPPRPGAVLIVAVAAVVGVVLAETCRSLGLGRRRVETAVGEEAGLAGGASAVPGPRRRPLTGQLRRRAGTIVASVVGTALVMALVAYLAERHGMSVRWLTRDVAAIAVETRLPRLGTVGYYLGLLSQLGLLIASGSVAVCLLAAGMLLRPGRSHPGNEAGVSRESRPTCRADGWFLFWSGMVGLLMLLDDAFLLHEVFFPEVLRVPERLVYLLYLGLVGSYLLRYRRRILSSDHLLLALSLGCLGLSSVLDQILPSSDVEAFWEDGVKFAGLLLWLVYYAGVSTEALRAAGIVPPSPRADTAVD